MTPTQIHYIEFTGPPAFDGPLSYWSPEKQKWIVSDGERVFVGTTKVPRANIEKWLKARREVLLTNFPVEAEHFIVFKSPFDRESDVQIGLLQVSYRHLQSFQKLLSGNLPPEIPITLT